MANKLNSNDPEAVYIPKTALILRKLLLDHRLRPYDLSKALNMANQTIHKILYENETYPKVATLLPIAKYFKITIGQLIGDEPLDAEKKTENEDIDVPGVWNRELYLQCAKYAGHLFEKHAASPSIKLAIKLITDIYDYSLRSKNSVLDETFADWYISQHAKYSHKR